MNAYIKFDEILSICSQDIEQNRNFGINQGLWKNMRKMMCDNPNVDLININAYIKFGEILSICSQDIEQKQNLGTNQGP